ncbi:hypothetical protein JZ751_022808 [Albula glossodonta]|uniref:Uncharacterized protein n=1 Tax=Albula glossodonta TaxID=121402 RepID=A0A8T2PN37_9TELE|nr:hypothetical protein JZ751_022808 [Albula glossodonta]
MEEGWAGNTVTVFIAVTQKAPCGGDISTPSLLEAMWCHWCKSCSRVTMRKEQGPFPTDFLLQAIKILTTEGERGRQFGQGSDICILLPASVRHRAYHLTPASPETPQLQLPSSAVHPHL